MRIDVSTYGIYPTGYPMVTINLWDEDDSRTIPVWLALQILINRVAYAGGGEVFLPAASKWLPVPMGNLRSYNIGQHRLTIPSNVTLSGEAPPSSWGNIGYSPFDDLGFANQPHTTEPQWEHLSAEPDLWQDVGLPPSDGTIIEFTGDHGPAIHVFRAKYACVRNLCIVARNLRVIDPLADSGTAYTPILEVYGREVIPVVTAPDWYALPDLYLNPTTHMWEVDSGPSSETIQFLDESDQPIGSETLTQLPRLPLMRVRWVLASDPGQEYDPKLDEELQDESHVGYERWVPNADENGNHPSCALHVNGAWHSRFENLVFFVPKKAVAVMFDAFRAEIIGSGEYLGVNPYYDQAALTTFDDDLEEAWSVFSPYNAYPGIGTSENADRDALDQPVLILNTGSELISPWGSYACNFRGISAFNGLIVVHGNHLSDGVTTCTFNDIWARRYVVRFCMGLTFTNCTAEGFSGQSPAFDMDPANFDHRITMPDGEGNPTSAWEEGCWDELRRHLILERQLYLDGREMGYLVNDAGTIQLVGCDIEDNRGTVCVLLGDNVDNFNGVGISAGLWTENSSKESIIGRPLTAGTFIPTGGPTASWGQDHGEFVPFTPYGKSSKACVLLGSANADAVDDHQPFQYRLRVRNPIDTEDGSSVTFPNSSAADYYPHLVNPVTGQVLVRGQVLEMSWLKSGLEDPPGETVFMAVRREKCNDPDPISARTGEGTVIRLDAGHFIDGGTNRIDLHSDVIQFRGSPVFYESSLNAVSFPSSLTSTPPSSISA